MNFTAGGRYRGLGTTALSLVACFLLCSAAWAQSPEAGLADAEARAATAEEAMAQLESAAADAEAKLAAAQERAAPAELRAERAADRSTAIQASLHKAHVQAVAEVERVEKERREAANDHDSEVASSLGLAIAALILAILALTWGWFRASPPVAYLARIRLSQAVALCVGGGFLAVVIGSAIGSGHGFAEAVGIAIVGLGLTLPVALLLGRHSAEIQRGKAKPILGRQRFSVRATQAIAALFALLCLASIGAALSVDQAESDELAPRTLELAEAQDPTSEELTDAEQAASELASRAAPLTAAAQQSRADLRTVKRQLAKAESRLSRAEADASRFSRLVLAAEKRAIRELEAEEREAAKLIAREEREAEEAEHEASAGCNPNYSGCLDPNASDYDCASGSGDGPMYTGTVEVIGYDEYGLDDDGDGIGCDLG